MRKLGPHEPPEAYLAEFKAQPTVAQWRAEQARQAADSRYGLPETTEERQAILRKARSHRLVTRLKQLEARVEALEAAALMK
jgi:hypothetical protein